MKTILLASQMTGCFPAILSVARDRAVGSELLFIPTAALGEGWSPVYDTDIAPFEAAGFSVTVFDLEGKTALETSRALADSHVVFVSGGNTFHLLHHMKLSGFADQIGPLVDEGVVYIGSSAGSVAATPDISYAASVDDPSKGGDLGTGGLAFVDRPVLPHMDHPAFSAHVREIADAFEAKKSPYWGLNDDEALLVDDEGVRCIRAGDYLPKPPEAPAP